MGRRRRGLAEVSPGRRAQRIGDEARALPVLLACLAGAGCDQGDAPPTIGSDRAPESQASEAPSPAGAPLAPIPSPWFIEDARASGIDWAHDSGHRERFFIPESASGGAALLDIEGDGDLDVYLVQGGNLLDAPEARPSNRMFLNHGDGTFEDVTERSGTADRHYGMGVATGDFDNDGDVDLYLNNLGPNILFANNGDGTFTDVTAAAGVGHDGFGAGAAFVDFDHDGDLDLFGLVYLHWSVETEPECRNQLGEIEYCAPAAHDAPTSDFLYRNNGDGSFTDVSRASGIEQTVGPGLGVVCADFDDDGWVDVFVANDGMKDALWMNQGNGTFEDRALLMGCAIDQEGMAKAGMGVAVEDVDGDGDDDLLVVNLRNESDSFYRNDGSYFIDETARVGLG
ncbi:MAG: FG-GAP repeat domain-containing protein, partial [Planctomycetota bacterium]